MLLSGSWDGTIRVWDIRANGRCLHVVQDHHADVYGLASHPARPFAWVSSSRDTTLRFWCMDDVGTPAAVGGARIKVQSILEQGLLQASHLEEDLDGAMKVGVALRLCGPASKAMTSRAVKDLKDLDRYASLFDFFTNMPGVKELWKLIDALVNNKPTDSASTASSLLHVNDVRGVALASARALHNSKNASVVGVGRRSDRLLASAATYLSLGHVREFCEIHVELGMWDKALAFAPAASMSYWKLLMLRHAFFLASPAGGADAQAATPYFLASGESDLLIAHQHRLKDTQGAFLSAVCAAVNSLPLLPPFDVEEEKKFAALLAAQQSGAPIPSYVVDDAKIERDSIPITDSVRAAAEVQANLDFARARPVLAACALLRIGDATGAVQKLLGGNEVLLAVAVARVLQLQSCDEVFRRAATFCEDLGLFDDALKCLLALRDPRDELILLAARFVGPANLKAEFYLKVGIRSAESFAIAGEQHVKDRQAVEALVAFVAGGAGCYERALTLGMEYLKELLNQPSWSLEEAQALLRPLHSINLASATPSAASAAKSVPGSIAPELRNNFLLYSYFVGAQVALNRGYVPIVAFLVESVAALHARLVASGVAPSFPAALIGSLKLQEASLLQASDPLRAQTILRDILADATVVPKIKAAALVIKKNVDTIHVPALAAAFKKTNGAPLTVPNPNAIVPASSNLPSGGSASRHVYSIISRQLIEGPKLNVDLTSSSPAPAAGVAEGAPNLNANFVSMAEALMLVKCTPYSPNHSGFRLKVYA